MLGFSWAEVVPLGCKNNLGVPSRCARRFVFYLSVCLSAFQQLPTSNPPPTHANHLPVVQRHPAHRRHWPMTRVHNTTTALLCTHTHTNKQINTDTHPHTVSVIGYANARECVAAMACHAVRTTAGGHHRACMHMNCMACAHTLSLCSMYQTNKPQATPQNYNNSSHTRCGGNGLPSHLHNCHKHPPLAAARTTAQRHCWQHPNRCSSQNLASKSLVVIIIHARPYTATDNNNTSNQL